MRSTMANKPRALQAAAYRYNCQPCKQRKTKCDRVRPCASCHLKGTQERCYVHEENATSYPSGLSKTMGEDERPQKRARFRYANATSGAGSSSKSVHSRGSPPSAASASASASASAEFPVFPAVLPSQHQGSIASVKEHVAMLRQTIDQLEAYILPGTTDKQSIPRSLSSSQLYNTSAAPTSADFILTNNDRLVWADVAHLFPPKRDVDRILDYFLREMVNIMIPVQEKQLWRSWLRLVESDASASKAWQDHEQDGDAPGQGVSRPMVGSLLVCLASTSFLIPQRREEELELTRPLAEQRDQWITCALALVRCGANFSISTSFKQNQVKPWVHYVDATIDASLDRFGFETLAVRIFTLLGISEVAYHLMGECLRRAIRINLFDESSVKAAELFTVDDDELTEEDVVQMRRRIGAQMVVTERWTCLYTGRLPMIDEEASTLPLPSQWVGSEEVAFRFSRYVSKLRQLPAELTALTTRKSGDWSSQRARDQEAVQRVLDIDRGLCDMYDPTLPRASLNGRSHAQIISYLPELLDRGQHIDMPDFELNELHHDFAEALVMTSSWLCLRCLATSNLMFLPWVGDVASRYYALNLARRLIELLPSIWMMANSAYVPFVSSWISRHLLLGCTVLSVPILGQEPSSPGGVAEDASDTRVAENGSDGGAAGDFAPSRMQTSVFAKPSTCKVLESNSTSARLPASSSIDLDWFSSKLVEIASLFSQLAERGDQTAGVNTRLIRALLNSRAALRDKVLDKLGRRNQQSAGAGEMGKIGSQHDLTSFVMAVSTGKSPSGSSSAGLPGAGRVGSKTSIVRKDLVAAANSAGPQRVASRGLHDLAHAVDTYTSKNNAMYTAVATTTPPLPSFSPQQPQQQQQGEAGGIGWDWGNPTNLSPHANGNSTVGAEATAGDAIANIPSLFLDTQDWLAILDDVDIPL